MAKISFAKATIEQIRARTFIGKKNNGETSATLLKCATHPLSSFQQKIQHQEYENYPSPRL